MNKMNECFIEFLKKYSHFKNVCNNSLLLNKQILSNNYL